MKRVYREVRVAPAGAGWSILLDARTLQTPARAPLLLPRAGLAQAIASWDVGAAKRALFDDGHQLSKLIGRATTPMAVTVADGVTRVP